MMIQNSSFIFIHRSITQWEWYSNTPTRSLFLHLIFVANHKDAKWQGVTIKRGQHVTSHPKLAKELGLTIQSVRTALTKLKSTGELTVNTTSKYSLVTINNYDKFQPSTDQLTVKQQATNRQSTTNNNDNNEDNENNKKNNILASSDATEISQFIDSFSGVNPSYKQLFKNKTQRASASNLLNQYGLERLLRLVGRLPQIMSDRYAPQITTPYELETKMAKLLLHLKKPANDKFNVTEL